MNFLKQIFDNSLLKSYVQKYRLNDNFSRDMSDFMKLYSYDKGEHVLRNGDPIKTLYFVVKGKLKVYSAIENGKTILLRFYTPLSIFGDLELFNDYDVKSNIESVSPVTLIGISFSDIDLYARDDSVFLRFILKNICRKLYTMSNSSSLNQTLPFINRFASYLISIASDENNLHINEDIKTDKLGDLATFLGVSYRHLNRVISELCSKGIIERTSTGLAILDYKSLKELSVGFYE